MKTKQQKMTHGAAHALTVGVNCNLRGARAPIKAADGPNVRAQIMTERRNGSGFTQTDHVRC